MRKIGTWAGWTYLISIQTPSALRLDCISESLVLSVSVIRSWIVSVTFFLFLEKLNIFLYLGLFEGLTLCWIKLSEKCRSQQHSNLPRKTIRFQVGCLNHSAIAALRRYYFFCRWLLNCCVGFTFSRFYVNTVFGRFRSVHKISTLDRKYPQWARLELELADPSDF